MLPSSLHAHRGGRFNFWLAIRPNICNAPNQISGFLVYIIGVLACFVLFSTLQWPFCNEVLWNFSHLFQVVFCFALICRSSSLTGSSLVIFYLIILAQAHCCFQFCVSDIVLSFFSAHQRCCFLLCFFFQCQNANISCGPLPYLLTSGSPGGARLCACPQHSKSPLHCTVWEGCS